MGDYRADDRYGGDVEDRGDLATSKAKTMKTMRRDVVVKAGGDDQGAEDEEGEHLQDRGVLGELDEALRHLALTGRHCDAADEGGNQAVADRHFGETEGKEAMPTA